MDLTVVHGLNSLKAEKEKQQQKKERNRRATILNFIDIHISVSFLRGWLLTERGVAIRYQGKIYI